ncbi:Uncharacterised protein [Sphingobacterium multivorum]|uniref:Uncharacterized protein n=1 Tax=Sphingobacterium multivorum TaxID=28454 RepID=A0A2X2J0E5_SPHMU|nr:hypothetical protein [Sphingobacterium multivorum]SPZ85116.1 Uncharacterised protein [Sphingobacterium multivorum]
MYKNYAQLRRALYDQTQQMKNSDRPDIWGRPQWRGNIMRISLTTILMSCCLLHVGAKTYGQDVSIQEKSVSLRKVFSEINKQTGYSYVWAATTIDPDTKVNLTVKKESLGNALGKLLDDLDLDLRSRGRLLSYTKNLNRLNDRSLIS